MLDGLWHVICESGIDLSNILVFVPSRRSARSVEKMIVDKVGHAVILPKIIPLGVGVDGEDIEEYNNSKTVSELERIITMSYLLAKIPSIQNITSAIPVARTLVTMQDYLENSGIDIADINWAELVDEKYAQHFQEKAKILSVLGNVEKNIFNGRDTETKARNSAVYKWCDYVKKLPDDNSLIIVCGSTASVPVTKKLMSVIASLKNGRIILSGKISGNVDDFKLDTNPYNAEYKFLSDIGLSPKDVQEIYVGDSHIDFMNLAFGNTFTNDAGYDLSNCHIIEANRESEEAAIAAEIAARAVKANKSVLIITPDAAGNQRLLTEFNRRGIVADFSGGVSGIATPAGRAILNLFDDWIETGNSNFENIYSLFNFDLFNTVAEIINRFEDDLLPVVVLDDSASVQVWMEIKKLSDCLNSQNIRLSIKDARAFIADTLSKMRVRAPMNDMARVVVLGTIESRMQTADVVILTGLNEGMFPSMGYANPWLPRGVSDKIGLPSPNHKVSLMALDFMTLSCGPDVYWLRSRVSGGVQTQESRFLSRVMAAHGIFDKSAAGEMLRAVRLRDIVPAKSLSYLDPTPPADRSDVYVTSLEVLIHNPYAFYVKHILHLSPLKDFWVGSDARDFGILVHDVLEHAPQNATSEYLVSKMDEAAHELIGQNNLIFYIWHKRFQEIAPVAAQMLADTSGASVEISGSVNINGRTIRARADRVWNDGVLDIKTGLAPTRAQIMKGNMPQLPLEALMLKNGGFKPYTSSLSKTPVMKFLQLKSHDVRLIEYNSEETDNAINATYNKVVEVFNMYSRDGSAYKYLPTNDPKYRDIDDFARVSERD